MAQVLAPIVQTTSPITMLHSSSDAFQTPAAPQPHHQQPRSAQMPRSQVYAAQNGGVGYRGTSTAPIAPYAFSSTPQLRQENRSTSAPNPHTLQQAVQPSVPARLGHPSHPSSSSDSTVSTSGSSNRSLAGNQLSKDDTALGADYRRPGADGSTASPLTLSTNIPDLSLSLFDAPVKPSPDRYRRGARRTDSSNNSTITASTPTSTQPPALTNASASKVSKPNNVPSLPAAESQAPARPSHNRANSADDMQLPRGLSTDQAKRYRRRSLSGLDPNAMAAAVTPIAPVSATFSASTQRPQELRPASSHSRHGSRPSSSHERQGSAGSTSSSISARPSSSRQESTGLRAAGASATTSSSRSTPESARRVIAPSPLSNPISPTGPTSPTKKAETIAPPAPSPAVQQLTALNDKESGKGMKSRLRRAFSFGSAAELRRATAENNMSAERAKLRKEQYQSEYDAEQAAIVAKQEAAGIGAGIYSGQGGFSGSTDNLSISSTASSASIMLRKMGHGMRKGGRSIKGLFRPKSVIGVPAADGPITQPSAAQVSMVTVEAERQKVNVNADPPTWS